MPFLVITMARTSPVDSSRPKKKPGVQSAWFINGMCTSIPACYEKNLMNAVLIKKATKEFGESINYFLREVLAERRLAIHTP